MGQPVNDLGLDHAVAVRTGPPEAARGPSRVNAAPGVDQERRLVHGFPQPRAQSGLPMLVEGRKLEDMMSKPPNILVQFPKSSPKMPVWCAADFLSRPHRYACTALCLDRSRGTHARPCEAHFRCEGAASTRRDRHVGNGGNAQAICHLGRRRACPPEGHHRSSLGFPSTIPQTARSRITRYDE